MSKPAWEYMTTHLPEIRRAVLPNTGRPIGEPGLALLLYLSGQTNKYGEFFMTQKVMQEETDIASLRQVEKLLAGFEQLGWITRTGQTVQYMERGRPTPVYVLTLFPQYAEKYAQTLQKSDDIPSVGTGEKTLNPNREKTLLKNNRTESEPQPETEPEPQPESTTSADRAGEVGLGNGELLAQVIAWEVEHFQGQAGQGLLKKWRTTYPGIVARALELNPPGNLVHWCIEQYMPGRTDYYKAAKPKTEPKHWDLPPMEPEPMRGVPGCPTCGGRGWYFHKENGRHKGKRDCECAGEPNPDTHKPTHEPTTERVSACEDTSTYLHTPDAPADSRSEIRQLSGQLFKRI